MPEMGKGTTWADALAGVHVGDWRIQDAIMAYDGSKRELIKALSGASSTKDKSYQSTQRNFNRWQAYEQGKESQQRKISPASQKKLNSLVNKRQNRDRKFTVTLDGSIAINTEEEEYYRDREIDEDIPWNDLEEMAEMAANGDEQGCWDKFAEIYDVDMIDMRSGDITLDYDDR